MSRANKIGKYKSKLEERFAKLFPEAQYEVEKLKYIDVKSYTPDFKIGSIFWETKGYFDAEDRRKHLLIQEQYPEVQVILVFENPKKKIHPKSKTTYGEWCDRHAIAWYSIKELETEGEVIEN